MPRLPLLRVLAPFAAGILLEDALAAPGWACAALGLAGALAWLAGRPRAGEIALGLGVGALALALRLHAPAPAPGAGPVLATVLAPPRGAGPLCSVEVWLHGPRPGRALLRLAAEHCARRPGERLLARVTLEPLRPRTNPGGRDSRRHWRRHGVRVAARLVDGALVPAGRRAGPAAALADLRARIGDALDPPGSGRAGGVLRALVTGDRSRLDPALRDAFARSGTAHLLAVSGLHVGWVFALTHLGVGWALRRARSSALLRRARTLGLLAGAAAAAGYAAVAGFGVPALRAAAMALAGAVALLAGRPALGANALCGAGLVVLACSPAALFDAGFALSFAAVSGILMWRPPPGALPAAAHATAAAALATAPLLAAIGAPLPAASLPANLLAIPVFAAGVVPLALAAGLAAALCPDAGGALHPLALGACELGLRLVESLGSPDLLAGAHRPVLRASALCAAGFAGRLAARAGRPAGAAALAALAAAALALPLPPPAAPRVASVTALDVGHGDALLVRAGARAWLVDAGPAGAGFDAGRHVVLPALRALGVARLDGLVLTHSDRDHLGGAEALLGSVPVGRVWLGAATRGHPAAQALRRAAARRGVPLRVVSAGDAHAEPGLELRVLWPPAGARLPRANETSLVLRVELEHGCAFLPGDAPAWVERRLARDQAPCALLKLAHHGSRSSSAQALLARLDPLLAVSSSGWRPHAPLPHPSVRARLAARDVSLYETARTGALRVRFAAGGPSAEPFLARDWRRAVRREATLAPWRSVLPAWTPRAGGPSATRCGGAATAC